ncbi:hypothetical protein EQV77_14145 [Halobacillus fulvus]|nr:hypothetical protein EQV77_14145 [Halobacillus fulvus]
MRFSVNKNPLLIVLVVSLIPIGFIGLTMEEGAEGWIGLVILLLISIPLLWALFQSYHEMTDEELIIVFGPIRKRVPFRDIKEVKYSYNPLSSPAWTMKRLEIRYSNYKSILVSTPQDDLEFKKQLEARCPDAEIRI